MGDTSVSLSLSLSTYHICLYVYIYVYTMCVHPNLQKLPHEPRGVLVLTPGCWEPLQALGRKTRRRMATFRFVGFYCCGLDPFHAHPLPLHGHGRYLKAQLPVTVICRPQ